MKLKSTDPSQIPSLNPARDGLFQHLVGKQPSATSPPQHSVAGVLRAARGVMNAESARLKEVRVEAVVHRETKSEERSLELILRDLLSEESSATGCSLPLPGFQVAEAGSTATALPPPPPIEAFEEWMSSAADPVPAAVSAKIAMAMALIEKIELFVRSSRPALAMSLAGTFAARVEIERTGPREVALRIEGAAGPPAPDDLSRIRDELRSRGLKLSALSVS